MTRDEQESQINAPSNIEQRHGLQGRAFVVSLIMLVIGLLWMRQAGIISLGVQVGESVPVIPAVGAILLLSLAGPLLSRLPKAFHFPRHQSLLVYIFLCIAISMPSVGVVRQLLPQLTVPFYFATPENNYGIMQGEIPSWIAPSDPAAIQGMYEGAPESGIPWGPWIVPLMVWTAFMLANFVVMYALMLMFRRQWVEKEHLTFPIVRLVMDVSDYGAEGVIGSFLRNPLMWTGFGLAAIYNIMNMLQAWNPAIPALGKAYSLGALLTERPWSALQPLSIAWRPENIGIGYLVSTEVLLSVWVFYLLERFANLFAVMGGHEISGMPFENQQAFGGYLALGLVLFWMAREHILRIIRKAFTNAADIDDSDEPVPYRTIVWAAIIGFAVMMFIAIHAGMWMWVAAVYFGLILLFSVTYSRVRAEAGSPMVWLFPISQQWDMMVYSIGSAPYQRGAGYGNMTIFGLFFWLARGYFPTMSAYQIEGLKIADEANIHRRTMIWWMIAALVIGLAGAYYVHLQAYYSFGANVLEGGSTEGGARVRAAVRAWDMVSSWITAAVAPDTQRTSAAAVGFGVTLLLVLLRSVFLRFPLHPLGYVMMASYGSPIWGPFFLVWIIKSTVLKVGGMGLYRQLIPFFLGLVLGHYFTAGVVWGSLSLINEMYRRYGVWFG